MDFSKLRTIDKADVKGKRVLVRCRPQRADGKDGKVTDATRLERVAPGSTTLAARGAKVIVMSHYRAPQGRARSEVFARTHRAELSDVLGREVHFVDDCIGEAAEAAVADLAFGDVLVLENLRFHKGEEKNDPEFAKALAKLGDIYRRRCLLHLASRARLDRGRRPLPAVLRRPADDAGDQRARQRHRRTRSGRSRPSWAAPRCRPRSRCS